METPAPVLGKKRNSGPYQCLEKKLEVVRRLNSGEKVCDLAKEVGVNETTVRRWQRTCHDLAQFGGDMGKRKTLRKPMLDDMEEELFQWVAERRAAANTVTYLEVQQMALKINAEKGGPASFQASDGWAQKFFERRGLKSQVLSGEMVSADRGAAEAFVPQLLREIEEEDIDPDDIYNFDEGALYYKALPSRSYVLPTETHPRGTKVQKDRVTIGTCANAKGSHKIPLLVIGKSAKPRCFRTTAEIDQMPVIYRSQRKGWMTRGRFTDWYEGVFIPEVEKKQREQGRVGDVLLLVDNASSHGTAEDFNHGRFRVRFLPPNTTALIQPMDQGVIAKVKKMYRRELVARLLKSDKHILEFYKGITIKDACLMVATAWEEISAENIRRAWRKLLPSTNVGVPAPSTSPDLSADILALMRSQENTAALTDAEAWGWFQSLEAAEAVIEDPEGDGEDSSDESEPDVTGGRPTAREAWEIVENHMARLSLENYTVEDIEIALSCQQEDDAPQLPVYYQL